MNIEKGNPVLNGVMHTILVLSGKGGVGKSSVTLQVAASLKSLGHCVGILDVDLCGPSIACMTGCEEKDVFTDQNGKWLPVSADKEQKLFVMSLAFFLPSKKDAVVWRGPKKNSMIQQLLTNVIWNVDYLIIDTPPGTSDEHISLVEGIRAINVDGAILVTTPQMMSVDDVLREVTFCKQTKIPIIGIIENMSGFVCPNCSECSNILAEGGGKLLAEKANIRFLGRIPIDPQLCKSLEKGESYIENYAQSPTAIHFKEIANVIVDEQMDVA